MGGSQALHSGRDPSAACRAHCRPPGSRWWRPAAELFAPVGAGGDAFPDGTPCGMLGRRTGGDHVVRGGGLYCLDGVCSLKEEEEEEEEEES